MHLKIIFLVYHITIKTNPYNMLSTTVYRKLPVVSTTTCHNLIRLSSTLTAPPSTPLNQVPKHSSNHEDSSIFVEPKNLLLMCRLKFILKKVLIEMMIQDI